MCLLDAHQVGLFSSLSYPQAQLALALGQASQETHRAGCLVSIRLMISALCRSSVTPVPRAGELRALRSAAEERRRFQDCDRPRPAGSPKPGGPHDSQDKQMRDPFTPAASLGALSCARAGTVTNEFCCLKSRIALQSPEPTMPILQK